MTMTDTKFRLEYACTPKEMQDAEALALREQIGGGSAWLTLLILGSIFVVLLAGLYLKVEPEHRVWVAVLFVAAWIFIFIQGRRAKSKPRATTIIDVTAEGLHFISDTASSILAWSAFSRLFESDELFVLLDHGKQIMIVLPRRAFPDDASQAWFRTAATEGISAPAAPEANPAPAQPGDDVITVSFRYGLRDCVDRFTASWFGRALVIGLGGMPLGVAIAGFFEEHEAAVYSHLEATVFFMLPVSIVTGLVVLLVGAGHQWLEWKPYLIPMTVGISEQGLCFDSAKATSMGEWTLYDRYKETPWSFILWHSTTREWLLLPKRSFGSKAEVDKCRRIIAANVRPSTWLVI